MQSSSQGQRYMIKMPVIKVLRDKALNLTTVAAVVHEFECAQRWLIFDQAASQYQSPRGHLQFGDSHDIPNLRHSSQGVLLEKF